MKSAGGGKTDWMLNIRDYRLHLNLSYTKKIAMQLEQGGAKKLLTNNQNTSHGRNY